MQTYAHITRQTACRKVRCDILSSFSLRHKTVVCVGLKRSTKHRCRLDNLASVTKFLPAPCSVGSRRREKTLLPIVFDVYFYLYFYFYESTALLVSISNLSFALLKIYTAAHSSRSAERHFSKFSQPTTTFVRTSVCIENVELSAKHKSNTPISFHKTISTRHLP